MNSIVSLAVLLATVSVASAQTVDSPQTAFYRGNSLYAEGRYDDAVGAYSELVEAGYDGGALRFNLGNAYFKAGDVGRAILNYERAETWIPADPDLEANLSYARSLTEAEPCALPTWSLLAFPLAARFSSWTLALLSSVFLAAALACWGSRRFLPRGARVLGYVALLWAVGVVIGAGSLGYRVFRIERPSFAVVVAPGDTPVRFEPATDGTQHFVSKQGTKLEVDEEREGWAQVTRCDGRRGWIERSAIEPL